MATPSANELREKRCRPCEGGVAPLNPHEAKRLVEAVSGWKLGDASKSIWREWKTADFSSAMEFLNQVARLAEDEDHHPDLHLTGYRNVTIELSTHAIEGLSENDFILAAKVNELPVQLKR
jgi:4a-hydroxytetrahydrobiopterin dehydratase